MNKKVTIEIDFESQSLNVSMNEARGSMMDEIFAVKPLGKTAYTIVRYENVAWIEAENNYSHLHMADGTRITVAKNIGAVENLKFFGNACP